jgi:hypothetical protein
VQALAAATMLHCAAPGGSGHEAHDTMHRHAAHQEAAADVRESAAADANGAPAAHAHDAVAAVSDEAASVEPSPHKCSACASCCTGLALPSRVIALACPEAAGDDFAAPLIRPAEGLPGGLERPPRSQTA